MYLSKFHLNIRNVMARKCLADCQIMHRSIQRLFHCSREESGTLYRMDTNRLNLYVWSKLAPDLTDIPEGMELMGVKNLAGMEAAISGMEGMGKAKSSCFRKPGIYLLETFVSMDGMAPVRLKRSCCISGVSRNFANSAASAG